MRRRGEVPLPSPGIAFEGDFLARVGSFAARLSSARERREGPGRNRLQGVGAEFVGFRPYRPGEDLRRLDWNLFARHKRPFVRVASREASERWALLLDTSASMGVGRPGKLQRAAEVATALAAVGLRAGAQVRIVVSSGREGPLLTRVRELGAWMAFLERCRAAGADGLDALARQAGRFRDAGRVFWIGDFLDLEPRALHAFSRRGLELFCVQILADDELMPGLGPVEWVAAERDARRVLDVDRPLLDGYERRLQRRQESWRKACAHHRAAYVCRSSAEPFEGIAGDVLAG